MPTPVSESQLKQAVKSALLEVLAEDPDLLKGVVEEAIEDIGLAQAIREGLETPPADREEVMRALGKAP